MCCIFQDLFYSQLPGKTARFIQLLFFSALLFSHGSHFGKASLALGKGPREYAINDAPVFNPS